MRSLLGRRSITDRFTARAKKSLHLAEEEAKRLHDLQPQLTRNCQCSGRSGTGAGTLHEGLRIRRVDKRRQLSPAMDALVAAVRGEDVRAGDTVAKLEQLRTALQPILGWLRRLDFDASDHAAITAKVAVLDAGQLARAWPAATPEPGIRHPETRRYTAHRALLAQCAGSAGQWQHRESRRATSRACARSHARERQWRRRSH
jgi:hypothetical protein